MAYKSRRRATYRASPSRGRNGSARRSPRASARPRGRSGSRGQGQTLKIVIEQVPASAISRPAGAPLQVEAPGPKKSKF